MKVLKRRSGRPLRRLLAATRSSSVAISATSRSLRASPNRKSTPLPSHQKSRPIDPVFRADSVVLAISAGNLRVVYARIGRCQGRPA
jgi:hypothetical protein